jgi:ELWxxDGT repeat protein
MATNARIFLYLLFVTGALLVPALSGQSTQSLTTATQLKNINTTPPNPAALPIGIGSELVAFGNNLYFSYQNPDNGSELWRSDGTTLGTAIVADLVPGPGDALPRLLTVAGNRLFFKASTSGLFGAQLNQPLWVSAGTAETTTLVRSNATAGGGLIINPSKLTPVGNNLYFVIGEDGVGFQAERSLWVSDGSPAGTIKLFTVTDKQITAVTSVGTTIYFGIQGSSPQPTAELWKSDGTPAGTIRVADGFNTIETKSSATLNGTTYFLAQAGSNSGLWKTDGTQASTSFVAAVEQARELVLVGNRLVFKGITNSTEELWASDGTTAGTAAIGATQANLLTVVNGQLFFAGAQDRITTLSGNSIIQLGEPTISTTPFNPPSFTNLNGTIYFIVTGPFGIELWKTDGTPTGTALVRDSSNTDAANPRSVTRFGNTIVFAAEATLWQTTGSAASTQPIIQLNPGDGSSQNPLPFQNMEHYASTNGNTFFVADDGVSGRELWATDGSATGTRLITDLRVGAAGSNPAYLTVLGNTLYFFADDGRGHALWKSDGTEAGTLLVKLFTLQATTSATPIIYNGNLLFDVATFNGFGYDSKLWISDGTTDGTVAIQNNLSVEYLTEYNGKVYFTGNLQLWVTDGTTAGTMAITTESVPLVGGITPRQLYVFNNKLYFFATRSTTGLWVSDGTEAGTQVVKDLNASVFIPGVSPFTQVGNTLFFTIDNTLRGNELWATDGTEAGTRLVRDINSVSLNFTGSSPGSNPRGLVAVGSQLVFHADDGIHGRELWVSDGTEAGTTLLTDLYPGMMGGIPEGMQPLQNYGRVFFTGSNLISDIAPGAGSSNPANLQQIGSQLYFSASDNKTGQEIWTLPIDYRVALPFITNPS